MGSEFLQSQGLEEQTMSVGQPTQTMQPKENKPWWRDETYASAIAGSIKGIFDYMNMQEGYKQKKQMQESSFDFERGMVGESVKRASTMPLLTRLTKPKGK